MTEHQALEAIAEQFATNWPAASGNVTYVLDNNALPTTQDTFALLSVKPVTGQWLTMGTKGTRRVERRGIIMVKCWAPANGGVGASAAMMDAARSVFEGVTLSVGTDDLVILQGDTQVVGTDGRWYATVAVFPFRYYASA